MRLTFSTWFGVVGLWLLTLMPTVSVSTEPGYRLQPGDLLGISVWREPELQFEALVRPDGGISVPLIGGLRAAGRTVDALRTEIEESLQRYVPEASVNVTVREIRGNAVYVLGKVARPGEFVIGRSIDVMQALSMAGGTTTYAELDSILILRRKAGEQVALPFRYGEVQQGRNLDQNIILQSGDIVVVP